MASRREFLVGLGLSALPLGRLFGASGFKLSVITDEISQDFGHACEVAAREFGLGWVELRAMHDKNIIDWDAHDIADAKAILQKFDLRVSEIASPVFKTDWAGAPKSPFGPKRDQFGDASGFAKQDELLERAFELSKAFGRPPIRIFDFWRLDDPKPYRDAIDDRLRQAAVKAGRQGLVLTLENEQECNTATGAEAARLLDAVREKALMLNWDPGNAAWRGETAFPDGYSKLPKNRIAHMHLKDVATNSAGKPEWAAIGRGKIDFVGQFRALKRDGYTGAMSLETHWKGGTPEESSRQSMAGLKKVLQQAEQS